MEIISFTHDSVPTDILNEYQQTGNVTLFKEDQDILADVWDLELYLFLANPKTIKGLKFRYYADNDLDFSLPSDELPDEIIRHCLAEFIRGYNTTFKNDYYSKELEESIWPLSRSDENIKKYTLKLFHDIHPYQLRFTFFNFRKQNNFEQLGKTHGFRSLLHRIITKHGWSLSLEATNDGQEKEKQGRKRAEAKPIDPKQLTEIQNYLLITKVISDRGINPKGGQVIAHLIDIISKQMGGSKDAVLDIIRPILKTAKPSKNFKIVNNKEMQYHRNVAENIFNTVFR